MISSAIYLLIFAITTSFWGWPNSENAQMPPQKVSYSVTENFSVPILMYHYIRDFENPDSPVGTQLSVGPANFEEQMKYIYENGYQTISLADVVEKRVPLKSVVLTFDDGYEDAYTAAFPILKKYNQKATFFVITDYLGREQYLNWDQVEEMKKSSMEFGSHTLSHPNLSSLNEEEAKREIFASKNDFEFFCYPSGKYNARTVELVKEAGYRGAATVKYGLANQKSDLFLLPRIRISHNENLESFVEKIK
jgi:peptidoglycan/xylan/chitin deacetylase (PgdA/CDA1 family)